MVCILLGGATGDERGLITRTGRTNALFAKLRQYLGGETKSTPLVACGSPWKELASEPPRKAVDAGDPERTCHREGDVEDVGGAQRAAPGPGPSIRSAKDSP